MVTLTLKLNHPKQLNLVQLNIFVNIATKLL